MDKREHSFLEAALEGAEATADLFLENEAINAIPVVGTAFKMAKGINDIRSRLLIAKIDRFINEPSLRRAADAGKLRSKILREESEQAKVGEALFFVLERVADLEKPIILAKLYVAYLDEIIDKSCLLRLIHCVDQAYISDLLEVMRRGSQTRGAEEWRGNLTSIGFTKISKRYEWDPEWKEEIYDETSLAYSFRRAIEHADRSSYANAR